VQEKSDGSPITLADTCANAIINEYLESHFDLPLMSEENKMIPYENRKDWNAFWMIDPIDGTREFVNKRREFTINIALIENGEPTLGFIYAPVFDEFFFAKKGEGSYSVIDNSTIKLENPSTLILKNGKFTTPENRPIVAILSRSHDSDNAHFYDYFEIHPGQQIEKRLMGSSLKFCRMAQGVVDVYIRLKPTMEWDTSAGQIIASEAGRTIWSLETSSPLVYNKENLVNPHFISF
jgi:3'(2'), 5'-bisphosphate nucleotidase